MEDQSFRDATQTGLCHDLPYVVEAAFSITEEELLQGLHVGLNWSVPLTNPLQDSCLPLADGSSAYGLEDLLSECRVDHENDPVALALHIAMPRFDFLDRGKGSVNLPPPVAQAVAETVSKVIKEWASIKRARDREHHRAACRQEELLRHGLAQEITVREAAYGGMRDAYLKASSGGALPAHARQPGQSHLRRLRAQLGYGSRLRDEQSLRPARTLSAARSAGMGAFNPATPQSLNLYAYVCNDPVNSIDPTGLDRYVLQKDHGDVEKPDKCESIQCLERGFMEGSAPLFVPTVESTGFNDPSNPAYAADQAQFIRENSQVLQSWLQRVATSILSRPGPKTI